MKAFCDLPFVKLKVWPDGRAANCCHQPLGTLGDLSKHKVLDVWNGKIAREIRQATLEGELHPACDKFNCPFKYRERVPVEFPANNLPTKLEIDIPDSECNINPPCIMCRRNRELSDSGTVEQMYETLRKLRFVLTTLDIVHVQGFAEPFYQDHIFRIAETINFKRHMCMSLLTNGTLLHQKNRDRFFAAFPRCHLGFSIDAATAETYKKIRRLGCYDRILEHVRACVMERHSLDQRVWITHNINVLTVSETMKMVEIAAELGVDDIQMHPTTPVGGDGMGLVVENTNRPLFTEAQRAAQERAEQLGVKLDIFCPLDAVSLT